MSVAAAARALLPETVGETKTKPSGSDSVATAGLLPRLTEAVTTTQHRFCSLLKLVCKFCEYVLQKTGNALRHFEMFCKIWKKIIYVIAQKDPPPGPFSQESRGCGLSYIPPSSLHRGLLEPRRRTSPTKDVSSTRPVFRRKLAAQLSPTRTFR